MVKSWLVQGEGIVGENRGNLYTYIDTYVDYSISFYVPFRDTIAKYLRKKEFVLRIKREISLLDTEIRGATEGSGGHSLPGGRGAI